MTSYEISKRLHELGFGNVKCKYYWQIPKWSTDGSAHNLIDADHYEIIRGEDFPDYIPAYTFEEIWGVLPDNIKDDDGEMGVRALIRNGKLNIIGYIYPDSDMEWIHWIATAESPAEAAAMLLVWLIENKHYEVSQ
jgi:hypothetical protein